MVHPPLRHRRVQRFYIDEKRLEFRRLRIRITDNGGQRIRSEAFPGLTYEAPMQRHADDMDGFAVDQKRFDALRDHSLRLDRTAVRPDPHIAAELNAFLLGEFFR